MWVALVSEGGAACGWWGRRVAGVNESMNGRTWLFEGKLYNLSSSGTVVVHGSRWVMWRMYRVGREGQGAEEWRRKTLEAILYSYSTSEAFLVSCGASRGRLIGGNSRFDSNFLDV